MLACLQYNAHAASKDPTLNCYSSIPLGQASFADHSRNCIKHLHKADLKNVLIVMLILCHKNGKEFSSECAVASCFKTL